MLKRIVLTLASASLFLAGLAHGASFADAVTAYNPGVGYDTDFSTGAGLTNAASSLGEPSRTTPGAFGGPVDPFNPPYLPEQLVSVGTGGSLTVSFSSPIKNDPRNPYGLDFSIYGNAGFVITNGNFSGGGVTDGSLFGANAGATRVYVSADNSTYYLLDPKLAPTVDTLFPTDGSGNFDVPVNPALTGRDFAGAGLTQIRALYGAGGGGAGGGAGFDLSWAQDANGQSVNLPEVRFIRVDVLSGAAEVDGFSAVVPEPAPWMLISGGLAALPFLRRARGKGKRP